MFLLSVTHCLRYLSVASFTTYHALINMSPYTTGVNYKQVCYKNIKFGCDLQLLHRQFDYTDICLRHIWFIELNVPSFLKVICWHFNNRNLDILLLVMASDPPNKIWKTANIKIYRTHNIIIRHRNNFHFIWHLCTPSYFKYFWLCLTS